MFVRNLAVLTLCSLMSMSYAGDRFGLARSSENFSIERQAGNVDGRANVLTSVEIGDTLQAGDKPLQIDLPKGNSFAVGRNSRAEVDADGTLNLKEGHLAASATRESQIAVGHDDLRLVSSKSPRAQSSDGAGMIAMTVLEPGKIKAVASNSTFAVEHVFPSGEKRGVAILGHNDSLVFVKRGAKWMVLPERTGQPVNNESYAYDEGAVDYEDDDDGAAWYWWAGGAAAAGGIAYWIYEEEEDEEDDEHREERNREREQELGRGPFTPSGPPDSPPGRPGDKPEPPGNPF